MIFRAERSYISRIDDAIRTHERLLLILSRDSMGSNWVQMEIRKAQKRERVVGRKRVVFPVRLASCGAPHEWTLFDADEGENMATEIREAAAGSKDGRGKLGLRAAEEPQPQSIRKRIKYMYTTVSTLL